MTAKKINKQQVIQLIINKLQKRLSVAITAVNQAHAAAIDEQSIAETQYDTLAIEAGYLAQGQAKRVQEYQQAITIYKTLCCCTFEQEQPISLTALIQLSIDRGKNHWFFIGPDAGGLTLKYKQHSITVITPKSPMGSALIGKQKDDDIEVPLGNNKRHASIYHVL